MEKKFKEKYSGAEYMKKIPRGNRDETFIACLGRLMNTILKKTKTMSQIILVNVMIVMYGSFRNIQHTMQGTYSGSSWKF